VQVPRSQVPKPTANPVPHHSRADSATHYEPHPRWLIGVRPHVQMAYNEPSAESYSASSRCEVRTAAHPRGSGQHRTPPPSRWRSAGHTLTRARPLRRRAASTARPARVRMRSLKPCVFARRRLFGWKVRLLTGTPDTRQDHRRQPSSVTTTASPTQPTPVSTDYSVNRPRDKASADALTASGQRATAGGVQSQTTERYADFPTQSNRSASAHRRCEAGLRPAYARPSTSQSTSQSTDTRRFPNVLPPAPIGCGKLGGPVWTPAEAEPRGAAHAQHG
jgi:hypothetical protein